MSDIVSAKMSKVLDDALVASLDVSPADEIQSLRQRVERLEGALREADIAILGGRMELEGKATNATGALAKLDWRPSRTHIEGMRNTMNRAIEYIDEARAALSPKVQEGE